MLAASIRLTTVANLHLLLCSRYIILLKDTLVIRLHGPGIKPLTFRWRDGSPTPSAVTSTYALNITASVFSMYGRKLADGTFVHEFVHKYEI